MVIVLLLVATLALEPAPEPVSSDAARSAQAAELEQQHDYVAASSTFAPLADAYPQDYATQLRAAWLAFLAADYATAERRYGVAISLSNGALEARSGLAWTWLRQGRSREAKHEFEALLELDPTLESAQAGLAELRPRPFAIRPMAHGIGHVYVGHPTLAWAMGVSVSAPMVFAERVLLSPSYRFTRLSTVSSQQSQGQGQGQMAGQTSDPGEVFDQHEAYVGAGLTWPIAGFLAQYGYLDDGSQIHNDAHVVGLSIRYSPWGDGILDVNAAGFQTGWIGRVAPAWRMPATAWLDVRPGVAVQLVDRELLPSGFASLVFHGRPGALVIGGKGGLEERPVYLETPAIFAFAGRIVWGAWFAGDVALGRGVHLHASYETHHLRAESETGSIAPTQIHYVALGLSWRSIEAAR